MERPPLKAGDIYPSHVLRDEYGMNAANRPVFTVEPEQVPEPLRFLIPSVERWAIPCDVTRGDYFDRQPQADVAAFWFDTLPHLPAIDAWLDSQPERVADWSDAAVHFMYFRKAHGDARQQSAEEAQAMRERRAAAEHRRNLAIAIESGLLAFRAKDYAAAIALLEPFAGELDQVTAAKLAFARKRRPA